LTYQGKPNIIKVSAATTGLDLRQMTLNTIFGVIDHDATQTELLKLLFKGKQIKLQPDNFPFEDLPTKTRKKPKIMVMATNISAIKELSSKRSDPLIRGFDQEKDALEKRKTVFEKKYWGDDLVQDKDYKFCRLKAGTDHSFGHRSTDSTPHAFRAMELLEKLAADPGIVAIMKERELVVGTLGEMDPIDDRIMMKTEAKGGCLLGYNTNRGLHIDIKLRTDDLSGFRDYTELVATLIHELSHNWVSEHNLLFWTNYAQMRVEYFCTHARLRKSALVVRGKKTAELAGLDIKALDNVFDSIMKELVRDMGQYGLNPDMIADPIRQRIQESEEETKTIEKLQGYRLGAPSTKRSAEASSKTIHNGTSEVLSARQLALAAAERRAREQKEREKKPGNI